MASPKPDTQATGGGKKKGKSKKPASTEDGVPSSSSDSQSNLKSDPGKPDKIIGAESSSTDKSAPKDKQQKKQEKHSKSPQSKLENVKPSTSGEGDGSSGGGGGEQPKSKAQLKAERRAVQEKQRAMKEAKKAEADAAGGGGGAGAAAVSASGGKKEVAAPSKKDKAGDLSKAASAEMAGRGDKAKKKVNKVDYHNLSEEERWIAKEKEMLTRGFKIDDGIFNLGFQFFHQKIVGANARCVALLTTLKQVIAKYRTPVEKELSRDLEKNFLAPCIKYINDCRPLSTSMGNAIKHLKQHISQIPQGTEDGKAIAILHEVIDSFIYDNITKAAEAVAMYANVKIDNGDVILVYAASSLIGQVLKYAHDNGKKFRVIVVEGRPRSEGKTMLRYLVRCGIVCSYTYIGSASHAMREATKVFLGAAAMFAIGDMHSRTGNAMIAALAKANNIPVLVCCETYKFTDKVQLSSGNTNQESRGKDLISIGHKTPIIPNYEEKDLHLLNIMYDVTHSRYITALVTELGMLPCTSVPVVLRRQEDNG